MNQNDELAKRTIIIFDWDDTLLASSFLKKHNLAVNCDEQQIPDDIKRHLQNLQNSAFAVLSTALTFGSVFIITNAEHGWVQLSAQKFLPELVPLFSKLVIISARTTYQTQYPDFPQQWKSSAFDNCLADTKGVDNVLSFGDSFVERQAIFQSTSKYPNMVAKSVKFAENPCPTQMCGQIDLIKNCFAFIVCHESKLDLQLIVENKMT